MTNDNTNDKPHPTHTIFKVLGDGPKADWIKVGVAFTHRDGKGLHLMFDGIPVNGHIAVRMNRERQPDDPRQVELPMPKPVAA